MEKEEKKKILDEIKKFDKCLPLIVNVYNEYLIGHLSLINMLEDDLLAKKILIKNEYGILGNLLYKYKDNITIFYRYLLKKDIENGIIDELIYEEQKEEIELNLKYGDKPFICNFLDYYDYKDNLNNNKRIVMDALEIKDKYLSSFILSNISDNLYDDKDVVVSIVRKNGLSLEKASDRLKDHDYIVKEAIEQNGLSLKYASDRLKSNKEFCRKAILNNIDAYYYIDKTLQTDEEFIEEMIINKPSLIAKIDKDIKNDIEFFEKLLRNNIYILTYIDDVEYKLLKEKAYKELLTNDLMVKIIQYEYLQDIN